MTVEYPSSGIVQLCPDDNVTISRDLDHVFRETPDRISVSKFSLGMQILDEGPVDGIGEYVSPHHPVPTPVLVDGMRYVSFVADQDDLSPPVSIVWEFQNVGTLAVCASFVITCKASLQLKNLKQKSFLRIIS